MNLIIGLVTGAFGLSMFITCQIAGIKEDQFVRGSVPPDAVLIDALILVTFDPAVPACVFAS